MKKEFWFALVIVAVFTIMVLIYNYFVFGGFLYGPQSVQCPHLYCLYFGQCVPCFTSGGDIPPAADDSPCQGQSDGTSCGNNQACQNGQCVSVCLYEGGECLISGDGKGTCQNGICVSQCQGQPNGAVCDYGPFPGDGDCENGECKPIEGRPCENDNDCKVNGVVCEYECGGFGSDTCKKTSKLQCPTFGGACINEVVCNCPTGTFKCEVDDVKICCADTQPPTFECKTINGNPYCSPLGQNSCGQGQIWCPGNYNNACCNAATSTCDTFCTTGCYAVCREQQNGTCSPGKTPCGNYFCCTDNAQYCSGFFPHCITTNCQQGEELCVGEDVNLCCQPGKCWIRDGFPSCLP